MNKTINPELVLAARKLAYPAWVTAKTFRPLTSDSDALALERALKKEGWVFYQSPKGKYVAFDINGRPESDDSDTLLLLKCVSAMTGLPLYLEEP